jgi:hypothetical protein
MPYNKIRALIFNKLKFFLKYTALSKIYQILEFVWKDAIPKSHKEWIKTASP